MEIWGYTLKIYSSKSIHLPENLLRLYGFGNGTKLIRRECTDGLYFRTYSNDKIKPEETLIRLRSGRITLPSQWIIRNGLTEGESLVYLIATENGFYIMARPEFPGEIK